MTAEVVACRPTYDITKAEQLMSQKRKSHMLCVDDGGKLVGVISLSDIAQLEDHPGAGDTSASHSTRTTLEAGQLGSDQYKRAR